MSRIGSILNAMVGWMSDPLVVETKATTQSCAGGTGTAVNIPLSKSGYYPLAIVGIQISGEAAGSADVRQYRMNSSASGSGTAYAYVWNNSSSAHSWTVTAHILWKKELGNA